MPRVAELFPKQLFATKQTIELSRIGGPLFHDFGPYWVCWDERVSHSKVHVFFFEQYSEVHVFKTSRNLLLPFIHQWSLVFNNNKIYSQTSVIGNCTLFKATNSMYRGQISELSSSLSLLYPCQNHTLWCFTIDQILTHAIYIPLCSPFYDF